MSAKVSTKVPHDLALYPKLALNGHNGPLPFCWSGPVWLSLVAVDDTLHVPVQIVESTTREGRFLDLLVYESITAEQMTHLKTVVSRAFCLDLDLLPFYREAALDPVLGLLVRNLNGLRPQLSLSPYEGLLKAVVRQLVRASFAREIITLLVRNLGMKQVRQGRVFYGFPTPTSLAEARKTKLLECKLGYKWKLIRQISRDVVSEDLNLQELSRRSDEEIIETLEGYDGIGYWTSRVFLCDAVGRLDAYPILDISLKRALSYLYFSGRPIGWTQVGQFFDSWRDHTGILVPYMFASLWLRHLGHPIPQAA